MASSPGSAKVGPPFYGPPPGWGYVLPPRVYGPPPGYHMTPWGLERNPTNVFEAFIQWQGNFGRLEADVAAMSGAQFNLGKMTPAQRQEFIKEYQRDMSLINAYP